MSTTEEKLTLLNQQLVDLNSVVVVVGEGAQLDELAMASAWSEIASNLGKNVTTVIPKLPEAERHSTVPFLTEMGFRDLEVIFPYQAEAVEKVSYNIDEENQQFHLVIKPHKGHPPLVADQVEFRYSGAEADLIIMIGVHEYEQLEHLYEGYEQLFSSAPVITFHTFEPEIGTLKFEVPAGVSYSQYLTQLIIQNGWSVSSGTATDLLQAIEEDTNSFQSLTTGPEAFEAVAYLMRLGARRVRRTTVPSGNSLPTSPNQATTTTVADFASALKPTKKNNKKKSDKAVAQDESDEGSLKYQPSGVAPGGRG